jgi:adenosylcobinamide-GDP ribazoletransferase
VKGFILAVQFLTRLPTPRIAATGEAFARSMRWFPLVGLVIGALVTGAAWLGRNDAWLGALAALVVWVGVTGALHLDGLADLADASGAAHKSAEGHRERLLAVLADPHVGSFGVVAIALQLIAKLVLLQSVVAGASWVPLLVIPFAARIGPLAWTRWMPSLHDGLASRFRAVIRPVDIALWTIALIAVAWLWPPILITPIVLLGWGVYLHRAIGGISGDGHGAGIEVTETVSLIAAVIWRHLA